MTFRLTAAALLLPFALAAPVGAQFIQLDPGTWVYDVTPDGKTVVGTGGGPGGGFYWNWTEDPAPVYIGGNEAVAISDDGSVIVGCISNPSTGAEEAARWTESTGWVSIGFLPSALSCPSRSNAYDVSGDGETIVGLSWDGCNGRGFVWDSTNGMQELAPLGNGQNRASAISGDGSQIGGFAQGNFNRTPARWLSDTTGSVYNMDFVGEMYGFNEDGSLAVGTIDGNGFYEDSLGQTFIGNLNGAGWSAIPEDITQDGSVIVGFDVQSLAREAWIWTAADGIVSMNDRLAAQGETGLPQLAVARAVSEDGRVVVGGGGAFPFTSGYIAVLNPIFDGPWENLQGGTLGANGFPTLTPDGPLTAGSLTTLSLEGAPPNAIMLAWLALNPGPPQNFFGGTIHTLPFNNQFFFFADAQGEWSATVPWPAGIPAGTEVFFQFVVEDVSVLYTLTLTNGVKGTTP